MRDAPIHEIDLEKFWRDPYPDLKHLRQNHPVAYVPQLNAILITRHDDILENEKKVDVFSSVQPDGLMQRLMGQNLMRKDNEAHAVERRAIFPAVNPRTVKADWKARFQAESDKMLDEIYPLGEADMVKDIAMRISGEALKIITGLTNISWQEMDRVSQGMIDGCANYAGDPDVEARCHTCTSAIDRYIDEMVPIYEKTSDNSMLSVLLRSDLPEDSVRANIKLAISGGQNEPRDVIAGIVWALLSFPDQYEEVRRGRASWSNVFEEYARWISPIGMSPREIAKPLVLHGVTLEPGDRAFFMYGSANRDERNFARPDVFDLSQDSSGSVAFGAGPHFCAGAAASRCLIGEVVSPSIFKRLTGLRLTGETTFGGWAFRGPLKMPVAWNVEG